MNPIFSFSIWDKPCVYGLSARLNMRSVEQPLVAGLYIDDTVLLLESEEMLQRIVEEFDRVYKRRKLKVNALEATNIGFFFFFNW